MKDQVPTLTERTPREQHPPRRRSGRVGTESLTCTFGPVLDLSVGGMRLVCGKLPKGTFPVELFDGYTRLKVQAEVTWYRRTGLFRREAGLRFVDVSPEVAKQLTQFATTSRVRRAM